VLLLPVAITASNVFKGAVVNFIFGLNSGSILMRSSEIAGINLSSSAESFASNLFPVINTERKSWNPTAGILPAITSAIIVSSLNSEIDGLYFSTHFNNFSFLRLSPRENNICLTFTSSYHPL